MIVHKTCAFGNAFIHVEAAEAEGQSKEDLARRLCHGLEGLGADGVVFYRRNEEGADFSIFNRDGSEAELSGNGMAGNAAVLISTGFAKPEIVLSTRVGRRRVQLLRREGKLFGLKTELGIPDFSCSSFFPFLQEGRLEYEWSGQRFHPVSMGNPHAVVIMDEPLIAESCENRGRLFETAAIFPQRTNVEFVFCGSSGECQVLYFERGVGPTQSSASGSAAVFAVLRRLGKIEDRLLIDAPGGRIAVTGGESVFVEAFVHLLLKADYFLH